MTKLSNYIFILFAFAVVIACSGKKESETAVRDEWPEMDEFHMVMAEAFHPYKDSANLEPAKATAAEMARVAEKWANSTVPEKVNNEEVKANLAQLKTDAAAFTEIAASGDTTKIASSLTDLHNAFHKLQEAWYGAGKEGHEHKH
jgi:hypothetical protein